MSRASIARGLLSLTWLWLATSSFTDAGARIVSSHLGDHVLFGGLSASVRPSVAGGFVGVCQLVAGLLLLLPARWIDVRRWGALWSALLSGIPLTLLFTNPVWMESLGGFPAIGSGQGLLKYAAALGLSVYLVGIDGADEVQQRRGMDLAVAGLIVPLLWIGAMKFTLPEARGIEGLLASSPLFSWMGGVFSVQGASNLIGLSELVAVAFLFTYWVRPAWSVIGGAMGIATFLATLSFLVTAPGWNPDLGFPMLGGTGVFLVKDFALLAASLMIVMEWWENRGQRGSHDLELPQ